MLFIHKILSLASKSLLLLVISLSAGNVSAERLVDAPEDVPLLIEIFREHNLAKVTDRSKSSTYSYSVLVGPKKSIKAVSRSERSYWSTPEGFFSIDRVARNRVFRSVSLESFPFVAFFNGGFTLFSTEDGSEANKRYNKLGHTAGGVHFDKEDAEELFELIGQYEFDQIVLNIH